MKTKFTLPGFIVLSFLLFSVKTINAQCTATVTVSTVESRCKATGQIIFNVTGGSGNFNYRVSKGSFNTLTSTNTVIGLQAGTYDTEVKDIVTGCIYTQPNIVVGGNYQDPRFQLSVSDVTCINGNDGSIAAISLQYGRGPFQYTIVAPSASAVGVSNSTGIFSNLISGDYYVRLTDSCGGIQTRTVNVSNYNWWISSIAVTKVGCDQATATITLQDSKGNTNISGTTFAGYQYGAVRSPGDTSWYNMRTFTFFKGTLRSITLVAKDLCGNIKTANWTDSYQPSVTGSVTITNQACADFTASITGQAYLTNPQYCLYDNANVQLSCNTTGIFNNIPYGSYCIRIQDICYDTTIQRCFNVNQPVPAVSASVTTSNLSCTNFTATVTGQQNLTNPQYCLFDNNSVQIACNSTGIFNNIPYGSYCIQITDGCTGTVLTRCFTRTQPVPSIGAAVTISNQACSDFTATINGPVNISNGQFCIYDNLGNLIACNSTGIFNGLPYGSYCINVINDPVCFDTTIVRCFTVTPPVPSAAASVAISNKTCSDFTAAITGQQNLSNPQYCLYDNSNVLIGCNTTGQFNNLAYGSYCIRIANDPICYDTTIQRCFTVSQPVPTVATTVQISNKACGTFTASITGQQNLTNPNYCLYDNTNTQISCNTTGIFTNVPYGNYCIYIINTCYDTTITRCFFVAGDPMSLNVTSTASCTIGTTDFYASWASSTGPYAIRVYNPGGVLVRTLSSGINSVNITGLPALPVGLTYKVVIEDQCANKDSTLVTPNASSLKKSVNANSKCPSGPWQNGSGDLQVFCEYNNGWVVPKIIKKGATVVNITYNFNTGNNYSFNTMEPETYVIEYSLQGCSNKVYDTFDLDKYDYPNLQQSAVYQCNNASFGVNAVVTGGVSPYTYEIIGSFPAIPSIISAPQASPSFNLNNGSTYSLVRLRSIDACGNATINDASILPLGNTIITASSNCFYNNITLTVDTIPNAVYTWYRKTSPTDSVEIATSQSHNIPYLLPSDTGVYVCKASVNFGCLTRVSSFNLTGLCGGALLDEHNVSISGVLKNDKTELQWVTGSNFIADEFVMERSTDGRNFKALGVVKATLSTTNSRYLFTDNAPEFGKNQYRIRIVKRNSTVAYSKVIVISRTNSKTVTVNPNPIENSFQVQFSGVASGKYILTLVNATGGLVYNKPYTITSGEIIKIQRPASVKTGTYFLMVRNEELHSLQVIKLLFR